MSLTAIELIEELEGLSPADLEREIEEQQERLARMQRLLSLLRVMWTSPCRFRPASMRF